MPAPGAIDLNRDAARRIRKAGHGVLRVVRVLTPRDTGDDLEVLYLAPGTVPSTAYLPADEKGAVMVSDGW